MYPYEDITLDPIELGGFVFVDANFNLMRAADEFGLAQRQLRLGM